MAPPEVTAKGSNQLPKLEPLRRSGSKQKAHAEKRAWVPNGPKLTGWQSQPTLLGGSYADGLPQPVRGPGGVRPSPSLPELGGPSTSPGTRPVPAGHRKVELELQLLPPEEILRQVLIERAGSLARAYHVMDVNRTGQVDLFAFEEGLRQLRIHSSPVAECVTFDKLFELFSKGKRSISLETLLGFIPAGEHQRKLEALTQAMWRDYHNKASAQRSRLARPPRWRAADGDPASPSGMGGSGEKVQESGLPPSAQHLDWEQMQHLLKQKHQHLRQQFREVGDRGPSGSELKRGLISGLVAPEEAPEMWEKEQRKMTVNRQRIEDAIRGCSRARQELADMRAMMASLAKGRSGSKQRAAAEQAPAPPVMPQGPLILPGTRRREQAPEVEEVKVDWSNYEPPIDKNAPRRLRSAISQALESGSEALRSQSLSKSKKVVIKEAPDVAELGDA